jgi:hypothetical protein
MESNVLEITIIFLKITITNIEFLDVQAEFQP